MKNAKCKIDEIVKGRKGPNIVIPAEAESRKVR
jgi:hypothetical protein